MKTTTALAGAALLVGALSACGGSDTDAYCGDLEAAQDEFSALEDADFASFDELVDTAQQLGEEAPDEVADDWETLNGAFEEFTTVLEDAGLEPSDLEGLSSGELPEGVDPESLQGVGEELQALDSEELTAATDAITEHADTECGIQLDDSSDEPTE